MRPELPELLHHGLAQLPSVGEGEVWLLGCLRVGFHGSSYEKVSTGKGHLSFRIMAVLGQVGSGVEACLCLTCHSCEFLKCELGGPHSLFDAVLCSLDCRLTESPKMRSSLRDVVPCHSSLKQTLSYLLICSRKRQKLVQFIKFVPGSNKVGAMI